MNVPANLVQRGVFFAAALLFALPALCQETGNAAIGLKLARTWCRNCHVVEGAVDSANVAGAPAFASIAAQPTTTPATLRAFLRAPSHPPMPDFQLSRQQMDDVAAYIMSQKHK